MKTLTPFSRKILISIFAGIFNFQISAQDLHVVADANTVFGFDLLQQIAETQPGENIFISPFSVSSALQMVASGAVGETKTQMESVLQTVDVPSGQLNAACKNLNQSLTAPRDAVLTLANSIWYQKEAPLKPAFVDTNKKFFGAELAGVDFKNPVSAQTINGWADKNTRGKIRDIVSFPFPPLTRVVLANAIYFKGKWEKAFDKEKTHPQDFHFVNGGTKSIPMMNQDGKFVYEETPDFQAVRLPYKGGLQMQLFLPVTNSGPQKLIASFADKDSWQKIQSGFGERKGAVTLPKFKIEYSVALNDSLQALGMKLTFDPKAANFSAMSTAPLFISAVKQKSYVAVDEEGTEAAAVTTVTMTSLAMMKPVKPFKMVLDRPFMFVITDDATRTVLFMGIVNDPLL